MSQWTHILGVIRFDSLNKNVWPPPPNKSKIVMREVDFIHEVFHQFDIPSGSESPIEIETILTKRGPTVVLTGDLRDYYVNDVSEIVNYLNKVIKQILQNKIGVWVRDVFISCNVEYHEKDLYIQENDNEKEMEEFPVKLYERNRKGE